MRSRAGEAEAIAMGGSGVSEEFTPPRLARLLHALPHVNVTLHRVNDTFAPHSPVYLEVGTARIEEAQASSASSLISRLRGCRAWASWAPSRARGSS